VSRRRAARLAAPAAFLAGVTAALLLVRAGLADREAEPPPPQVSLVETSRAATEAKPKRTPVYATVEAGDTLEEIALEHGTTVERLLELNPAIDPTALTVGQKVRVR
jgi:LysM repeat protein